MAKKKSKGKKKQNNNRNVNNNFRQTGSSNVKRSVYRPETTENVKAHKKAKASKRIARKIKGIINKLSRLFSRPQKLKKHKMREKKRPFHKIRLKLASVPKKIIAVTSVCIIIVLAGGVFTVYHFATRYEIPQDAIQEYAGVKEDEYNIRDIDIGINEQLQKVKMMHIKGDKKAFKFFARDQLVFNEWYEESAFTFGNVSSNNCILIASILDKDGNLLYRSRGLEPGKLIPRIKLFQELPYGSYDAMLVVAAYDAKTKEMIGVQYTRIRLVIGIEYSAQEQTQTSNTQ
jgi:cell division protein FtsL